MLLLQRQALERLQQEKRSWQQKVGELSGRVDQLLLDKAQLEQALATNTRATAPLAEEQTRELLRLRGEAGQWHLQERQLEQSRWNEMQAAQAKLPEAEALYARLTNFGDLVSSVELQRARFKVELLRAQAGGNSGEVAQVRLRQAEEELTRATELRRQSLISQTEYDEALRKVVLLRSSQQP